MDPEDIINKCIFPAIHSLSSWCIKEYANPGYSRYTRLRTVKIPISTQYELKERVNGNIQSWLSYKLILCLFWCHYIWRFLRSYSLIWKSFNSLDIAWWYHNECAKKHLPISKSNNLLQDRKYHKAVNISIKFYQKTFWDTAEGVNCRLQDGVAGCRMQVTDFRTRM